MSECACESEPDCAAAHRRHKARGDLRLLAPQMHLAGRIAAEKVNDFVYRVDKEGYDVAYHWRAKQMVVMAHDISLQLIEQFAYDAAHKRGDENILDRRALHAGFDAELPAYGGDARAVEQRLPEVEPASSGSHKIGRAGIRVEYKIEYHLIVIPFGPLLKDIVKPAGVERIFLQFLAVPCRSILRETLQNE